MVVGAGRQELVEVVEVVGENIELRSIVEVVAVVPGPLLACIWLLSNSSIFFMVFSDTGLIR